MSAKSLLKISRLVKDPSIERDARDANDTSAPLMRIARGQPVNAPFDTDWFPVLQDSRTLCRIRFTHAKASGDFELFLQWSPDDGKSSINLSSLHALLPDGSYPIEETSILKNDVVGPFDVLFDLTNVLPPSGCVRLCATAAVLNATADDTVDIWAGRWI